MAQAIPLATWHGLCLPMVETTQTRKRQNMSDKEETNSMKEMLDGIEFVEIDATQAAYEAMAPMQRETVNVIIQALNSAHQSDLTAGATAMVVFETLNAVAKTLRKDPDARDKGIGVMGIAIKFDPGEGKQQAGSSKPTGQYL